MTQKKVETATFTLIGTKEFLASLKRLEAAVLELDAACQEFNTISISIEQT